MMARLERLTISAPGRICLFGEHQDYLDLPVIPVAISLRIRLEGARRKDRDIHIELPDIDDYIGFSLDDASYVLERDYFRSGVNVLEREGFTFSSGFDSEKYLIMCFSEWIPPPKRGPFGTGKAKAFSRSVG
ncbi:unnamed protein product [marine sediment metagenome]|uniref:Galactokinase N-terminal domain-containing protein n=1 Tax=marine sediment metagenome TaxID=412755 RepID=X1C5C7_9ZZZZ